MHTLYRIWSTDRQKWIALSEQATGGGEYLSMASDLLIGQGSLIRGLVDVVSRNRAASTTLKAAIVRARQVAAGGGRLQGYTAATAARVAASLTPAMLVMVMSGWSTSAVSRPSPPYLPSDRLRRRPCRLHRRR